MRCGLVITVIFFFQAEDGIRDLVRSRGLGDVYKRQMYASCICSNGDVDTVVNDDRYAMRICIFDRLYGLSLIHI